MLECVWVRAEHACAICLCMHIGHALPRRRPCLLVEFMHLVCVCLCLCLSVCLRGRESVCPCDLSYDVYLTVGLQFQCRADVRISISPFHFQMGLNLQCPYWFIMTHFDYLSVGSHNNPKQHRSRGTKRHQDESLETETEE